MRKALAALTLVVVAFFSGIFPALADDSDLYGDAYEVPVPFLFGDGVYGTSLALGVIATLALLLVAAILATAIMNRSNDPNK